MGDTMSDGITDHTQWAIKEVELWQKKVKAEFLSELPKEELIAELCKRDDVTNYHENFTNFKHRIIVVKE